MAKKKKNAASWGSHPHRWRDPSTIGGTRENGKSGGWPCGLVILASLGGLIVGLTTWATAVIG